MRLIILALVIVLPLFSQAQSYFTISGALQDRETGEPLVFASIGIKDKPISTVSNSVGEFDFHIPATAKNDYLIISMLGYENFQAPVSNFIGKDTVVLRLNKAVQVLDEVVIKDSLNGGEIVRIALSRIEQNYPMQPYLMDGFYRDLKKLGGTYFSLLEAAVKIYDEDYMEPRNKDRLREKVALMEVRKSLSYETHKFSRYFQQNNLLEDLLLHNNIKYRNFPEEDAFFNGFQRLSNTYYNGHKVFVVSINSDSYTLKMFIDRDTYAIIRMQYQVIYENNTLRKKVGSVSRYISDSKVIGFKQYGDKMYLNYIKVISQFNWYDAKTNELNFETEMHQELLINKVYPNTTERIGSTRKMKRYGLQYQDDEYNKEFWESYNVIKDTPLDKEIVSDLEKLGTLNEQFEKY
ncbi:carboxypeptidase-like regulatory domain-containing protein [Fulvivirga sp. M361]|uniref:carboxypeptidase-like regulatory domain-containing protein n=1 Tax=Fulvivirga sp. M361 TaxID=2594266 RepID=UPI001179B3B8|nr:carboxypeptidase-like regulatory domain-containing protein [Fulvivirga sp. M361]TRX53079.1 carboxypeptidase-like regulatory domain-containing protein [Fulvivirga sp. M361]